MTVRNGLNLKRMRHSLLEEIAQKQWKWTRSFKEQGRTQAAEGLDVISGSLCHWSVTQFNCNILRETVGKIAHLNTDTRFMSHVTGGAMKKCS